MAALGFSPRFGARARSALACGALALAACNSLLDLDSLKKVDCTDSCDSVAGSGVGAEPSTGGDSAILGGSGATSNPGAGGSHSGSAGTGSPGGASMTQAGSSPSGGSGILPTEGGAAGGDTGPMGPCPGGPVPPKDWLEHWEGHNQALTLRDFNDCVAIYVDAAMSGVDTAWLSVFLDQAWQYNLKTYGSLGSERVYVVLHQGKYLGGHASAWYETTHDGHNVIDVGQDSWKSGDYDQLSATLSALVERTAVSGKRGAPAHAQWGDAGFAQIYEYDLLLGLGMATEADKAWHDFEPIAQVYPAANSYWFSDFYSPVYKDHGKTKQLTQFFALLTQYYGAPGQIMPPMNWGEYIHFMSGAAGADVTEQATYAFGWDDTWQAQLDQAKTDYPAIKY
ncbi:MAG TPA: hypothetical protein VHB79_27280 [Polyangiaceae bacterium]|nr:hypothetical protein [Polyangiaceae bacterium]